MYVPTYLHTKTSCHFKQLHKHYETGPDFFLSLKRNAPESTGTAASIIAFAQAARAPAIRNIY